LRAAGRHVVDVENQFGKALVEDAGLYREGSLRSEQVSLETAVFVRRHRAEPKRHAQGDEGAANGENAHGQENAAAADTQSGKGDNLAVRGHAAKAKEHANQHGHGERKGKDGGENAQKKLEDLGTRTAMTDEKLHQLNKLRHEKNESKYGESEECVTKNFTNDIAVEDAHGANRECNTALQQAREREPR
jgi:hypothetical protein